jgi:hypothetical protein
MSYNNSVFVGNQTSLNAVEIWNDQPLIFVNNQFWQFNIDGSVYATSEKMLCAMAKYVPAGEVIILACSQNYGRFTTIYNLEYSGPTITIARQETIALTMVDAVTFNPNVNAICVVGVDANNLLAVLCAYPSVGKFSGFTQTVSGFAPIMNSAASAMGFPGMIAVGYVIQSGKKEFFAASFNSTGGAMSTLLLRSAGQFVNAVAILPCTTSVSYCHQFSLYVGGLVSSTTQLTQGFLTLLVGSQLSESSTFQCDEASQLTDGIIVPTTESAYPLAFSVGFTTAPGTSIYNNVLLVKLFNNQASAIRVRLQEHQQVTDCQLKQLGPGFLVWCLVQTQGLGELVTFYVNDQLSVQALPSTYEMLSDVGFSSGISFIWSAPAMISTVWQSPIFTVTPTLHPSPLPSVLPSKVPTRNPTMKPTHTPTLSQNPTTETRYPTVSREPTLEPSSVPSEASTQAPTEDPSESPSDVPSAVPSESSSARPSLKTPTYRATNLFSSYLPSCRPKSCEYLFNRHYHPHSPVHICCQA